MRGLWRRHWTLAGGVHVGVRPHVPPPMRLRERRVPGLRRAVERRAGHGPRPGAGHRFLLRVDSAIVNRPYGGDNTEPFLVTDAVPGAGRRLLLRDTACIVAWADGRGGG
jgi:hypothetical protein